MKYFIYAFSIATLTVACQSYGDSVRHLPRPTQVAPNIEEGADEGAGREAWIEYMHKTAPGESWRAYERDNKKSAAKRISSLSNLARRQQSAFDSIAPGVSGRWHERGSRNNAGSVIATAYDALSDELYAVSAGGTLWAGPSDGSNWRVVNQEFQFDSRFLGVVRLENGTLRIISSIDVQPAYSDDGGQTWQRSNAVAPATSFWSYTRDYNAYYQGDSLHLFALSKADYWSAFEVLYSNDLGTTWSVLDLGFTLGSGTYDVDLFSDPTSSDFPFMLTADGQLYRLATNGAQSLGSFTGTLDRANLTGSDFNGSSVLYLYDQDNVVFRSQDQGASWASVSALPKRPWGIGIYAHPNDPLKLLMGEVEAYASTTGGLNFQKINNWGAYYSDIEGSLHADMMTFNTFVKTDGSTFTVSANHGGLNVSTNWFETSQNIGLEGLNVGQFYSVTSHEQYPGYIFGGTQDQGYQMGKGDSTELIAMDQVISGDYGHLTFTRDGSQLWMMYPGTAVSVYSDPTGTGWYDDWLEIESQDETVWLAPMAVHPDPSVNSIIAAGGSIVDDGEGSFLITYTYDGNEIIATEGDYDFKLESAGGVLSALEVSPLSNDRIYAATDNGRFFVSADQGDTWTQSVSFIPTGNYLYGQAIAASPTVDSLVWLAGSGYSDPGIWRSEDAGQTFNPEVAGLPNTMTFELAMSPDGEWLFAATEAGPYVMRVSERVWYPLQMPGVPTQSYWSVDYVAADSVVRFGTYGRGIWDLKLGENEPVISSTSALNATFEVFPNPTDDFINISSEERINTVTVHDLAGREVMRQVVQLNDVQLNVSALSAGTYIVTVQTAKRTGTKQLIVN